MAAVSVAAGAFGAHALKTRFSAESLALWDTAVRYLMVGSFGTLGSGLANLHTGRSGYGLAAWCLSAGAIVFAGTVGALAFGGPRWLGAVTPVGGGLMIVGFLFVAWTAWRG